MKSRNILILALIMALGTTFLFNKYLKDLDRKYRQEQKKIGVVVSRVPISRNEKVTKEMLEIREMSSDSVHPEALRNIQDVEGKYALIDIKPGEELFLSRFTDQYEEKEMITRKIREGYRAVSIEANLVESVSNLIEPEDFVDVVFTESLKQNPSIPTVNTSLLLENVRVLAVGRRIAEKEESKGEKTVEQKDNANAVLYTAVTLELKPQDAVKLINADERGDIKLILRSKIFLQ